ncbi:MAG TPA: transcriptional regulator HexR [Burkholderiales bacterium]|nr:transcriptional regulator HexR [Burkholderiales bacterium]
MLSRLETIRSQLRKSEQRVADLVLSRPNEALNLSIATLAERAHVSQPTVVRFCRALGCSGYKDFKLRLAQGLASHVPEAHSDVHPDDPSSELAVKIFDRAIATLIRVRGQLDSKALRRAIDILAMARKIEFYGVGNSGIVAEDAQHKFFRLDVPAVAYVDPHIHGMAATMLHRGDAVVAISSTGRTIDLLKSVELARETGADVIGVTHSGSPLAKLCTVALLVDVLEDSDVYSPMTSRIAHLSIIDTLAVGVALKRGPAFIEQLERSKRSLREKRVGRFE